jgi:hypothetical protein
LGLSSRERTECLLVLLMGVFLSPNGFLAAAGSTVNSEQKHDLQATAPAGTSKASSNSINRTQASATRRDSASHQPLTPPSKVTRTAAAVASSRSGAVVASRGAPSHGSSYVSQRSSARRYRGAQPPRARTLTSQQRLARLHLEPERVQEIQQALIREGYLTGEPNGQWDSRTHDAMLRYQTEHGFLATGLPEAKSLLKLGLGSHPLPPDLDHGAAAGSPPAASAGDLTAAPASAPVSQPTPPS